MNDRPPLPITALVAFHAGTHVTVADVGPREPRRCHRNAAAIVEAEPNTYTWWTGMAAAPTLGCWVCHSWVSCGTEHFEVTWPVAGAGYVGMSIPSRVAKAMLELIEADQ